MNFDKVPELPDVPARPVHRRRGVWLAGVISLLVAGSAAYWQAGRPPPAQGGAQKLRAGQTDRLEQELESVQSRLTALPDSAALAARRVLLEEALARQNELLRLRASPVSADSQRLGQWQAQLGETVAREQERLSRELEAAAEQLQRQGRTAAAGEKFQEALRLQRGINRGMADRQLKSYGREAQLQRRVEELVAEPLLAEARRTLADARAAAAGGNGPDAPRLYQRAREIQQQLNRDFPRSRFSDVRAEDRLGAELAAFEAVEAHARLQLFLAQAAASATSGDLAAADRFYAQAAGRQQLINTRFAQSRFVSTAQLEQIEVARQTLRVKPLLARLHALDRRVAGHLRRREVFQAQQLVTQGSADLEAAVALSPRAQGLDEAMRERLNFLGLRSAELVSIQDQTYDLLLPLPNQPQSALLKRMVPQALFAAVMNTNPSRKAGRALPVDSVSRTETEEFCRRLGWVLGASVSLPTAEALRAAGQSPEFRDLTGGMDEWFAADGTGGPAIAPLFGAQGGVKAVPRTERARTTGFRVVVAVDLLAAEAP